MVWAILHPQDMADEDRKKLKDKLVEHFGQEQGCGYLGTSVTSFKMGMLPGYGK